MFAADTRTRFANRATCAIIGAFVIASCSAGTASVTPSDDTVSAPRPTTEAGRPTTEAGSDLVYEWSIEEQPLAERVASGDITGDDLGSLLLLDGSWNTSLATLIGDGDVIVEGDAVVPPGVAAAIDIQAGWMRAWRTLDDTHQVVQEIYLLNNESQTDDLFTAWSDVLAANRYRPLTDDERDVYEIVDFGSITNVVFEMDLSTTTYPCGSAALAAEGAIVTSTVISHTYCDLTTTPWAANLTFDTLTRARLADQVLG